MPTERAPPERPDWDARAGRRNVTVLAFVSLLNDIASDATLRLLPLFLSQVLGAGSAVIGLVEGAAESTATLTKLFSGWLSDRLPRRKPLVVAGYALSGLSKPFLLLASHWSWVLFVRLCDRLGKGLRAAPRDALIADESAAHRRGHSFGLNRALDTVGGLIGVLIAYVVLSRAGTTLTREGFTTVVLIAIVPAVAAVVLVAFGVREQARALARPHHTASGPARLPPAFWRYISVVALFTLANSSDAFLVLKAARAPGGVLFALGCLVLLNLSSSALAIPAGRLSDRIERRTLIVIAWCIYAAVYLGFAFVPETDRLAILALFFAYGCFFGLAEGVERALVADMVPSSAGRGLAFGIFNFTVGAMAFPASLLFGLAASRWGEAYGFMADAGLALVAAAGLVLTVRPKPKRA